MKLRQFLLSILMLVLLASCSTRFLYDRLDWLISWQVNSLVALTPEQEEAFRSDLRAYLETVREDELPRIAADIDSLSFDVASNALTEAKLEGYYQRMLAEADTLMIGMVPLSVSFLKQLSPAQQEELFASLTEFNDEVYEEYSGVTPEERRKNRNKSSIRGIQRFTGRLSKEQKSLVDESLTSMADASEEWVAYQRQWQARFFQLLKDNPREQEYSERLTELFVYPRNFHTPEYRTRVDSNREIVNAMLAQLSADLTDKQRRNTVTKLNGYAELLNRLAASG
jgi:hypothetical protein